jgi:hypothetical protein
MTLMDGYPPNLLEGDAKFTNPLANLDIFIMKIVVPLKRVCLVINYLPFT